MSQRFLISTIVVAVLCGFAHVARIEADPPKTTAKLPQASDEFVRLDADVTQAISQGDTQGCGPVSLLNLLKLGPESHKKAYTKLTNGDDSLALKLLAEKYCSPNGAEGKVRYSNRTGIDDPNLSRLCTALATDFELPPIETLYTTRKKAEANPDFAKRVNEALIASLSRGVPVLMSIDSYGEREKKWTKLTGHYMLFTGVQRISKANPSSFLVEYVNPVGGEHRQAFVYAGRRKHEGAFAHFKDGDEWLKNDPYLCLSSPYTDLGQSKLDGNARHEFFLTILFGQFRR
ncbi:MAG: hypothetical protein K8U57_26540 [Planctomycetes bacterium]|nr:hypothetical protein [Planctomycetota bacterium]